MTQDQLCILYSGVDSQDGEYMDFINTYIHQNSLEGLIESFTAIYNAGAGASVDLNYLLKDFAHILQNNGSILKAYRYSSEVLINLSSADGKFILSFLERLQGLFYKMNTKRLSDAIISLMQSHIEKIIDEQITCQLQIAELRNSFAAQDNVATSLVKHDRLKSKSGIDDRLSNHVKLSIVMLNLIDFTNTTRCTTIAPASILGDSQNIKNISDAKSHFYNKNRANYICAIAALLDNRADLLDIINNGIRISQETNYHFFRWKYLNLEALHYLRIGVLEKAEKAFVEAYELMNTQGFLFLGDLDPLTSNFFTVANYINFLLNFKEFTNDSQRTASIKLKLTHLSSFDNDLITFDQIVSNKTLINKIVFDKTITIMINNTLMYIDSIE